MIVGNGHPAKGEGKLTLIVPYALLTAGTVSYSSLAPQSPICSSVVSGQMRETCYHFILLHTPWMLTDPFGAVIAEVKTGADEVPDPGKGIYYPPFRTVHLV